MIDFKQLIRRSILGYTLPNLVARTRISPSQVDISEEISAEINSLFSRTKIDIVSKFSPTSLSGTKQIQDRICMWFDIITSVADQMTMEFEINSDKYIRICNRIVNDGDFNTKRLDELLNYSCNHIDNVNNRDKLATSTANIGSFVVLPYSLSKAKVYNKSVYMTAFSIDEITYSNVDEIVSFPFENTVSVKYLPTAVTTDITISLRIRPTTTNLIYINASGNINSTTLLGNLNGETVISSLIDGGECLFNFNNIELDSISFVLNVSQLNVTKQNAITINDIIIFSDILFMNSGSFESEPIRIDKILNLSRIMLNAVDYNVDVKMGIDKYLSLATTGEMKSFIKVSDSYATIDVPVSKTVNTHNINNLELLDKHYETTRDYTDPRKEISSKFYKYQVVDAELTGIDYKNMLILAGTNVAYGSSTDVTIDNDIYENWTRVGNFYKTTLVNFESGVNINIGKNKIKINGRELTGNIVIPIGFLVIEIHESSLDKTFGLKSSNTTFNGIMNLDTVYTDPLFPNNFTYKLAGLPLYDDETNQIAERKSIYNQPVHGVTVIQTNDPFLPLSMTVSDNIGDYNLNIGLSPIKPGTFIVEPNKGLVRVFARDTNDSNSVNLSYIAAQRGFKPCGILFNRLQKYIPYKTIHNMLSTNGIMDDTYITYLISKNEQTILIPEIKGANIFHNKLLYATSLEYVYSAIKLFLKTSDRELTPIVKNMFLEMKNV